jgi:hypothetical protein
MDDTDDSDIETEPESLSRALREVESLTRRGHALRRSHRRGRGERMLEYLEELHQGESSAILDTHSASLRNLIGNSAAEILLRPFAGGHSISSSFSCIFVMLTFFSFPFFSILGSDQTDTDLNEEDEEDCGMENEIIEVEIEQPSKKPRKERMKQSDFWLCFKDCGDGLLECALDPETALSAGGTMNRAKTHQWYLKKKKNNSTSNLCRHMERYVSIIMFCSKISYVFFSHIFHFHPGTIPRH